MTYRCRYCLREFSWERHSYPYVRSLIVLHLGQCHDKTLSAYDRTEEASRIADELFGFKPSTRDADRTQNGESTGRLTRH